MYWVNVLFVGAKVRCIKIRFAPVCAASRYFTAPILHSQFLWPRDARAEAECPLGLGTLAFLLIGSMHYKISAGGNSNLSGTGSCI